MVKAFTDAELKLKVEEYRNTGNTAIAREILSSLEPKIEAQVAKWSGSIPEHVIRGEAYRAAKRALDSYNPNMGASFNTHLYNHLQTISRRVYMDQNVVRLPEYRTPDINSYKAAGAELYSQNGYFPTSQELANSLGWSKAKVKQIEVSLKGAAPESSAEYMKDIIDSDQEKEILKEIINELDFQDKELFKALTGCNSNGEVKKEPLSDSAAVKKFGLSRSQLAYRKRGIQRVIDKVRFMMGR